MSDSLLLPALPFRRDQILPTPTPEAWTLYGRLAARSATFGQEALSILENMEEGIYGLDTDGYVTFTNPAAQRMTGWSLEDLQGRTQHSMVHHSHADGSEYPREACPIHRSFCEGISQRRQDEVFWRKDGTSFPVFYTSTPIFRDGAPSGAVVVFRDISQPVLRRRWERATRNLLLELIAGVPLGDAWQPVAEAFAALHRGYTIGLELRPELRQLLPGAVAADDLAEVVRSVDLVVDGAIAGRLLLRGPHVAHRAESAAECLAEEQETLRGALLLAIRNGRATN